MHSAFLVLRALEAASDRLYQEQCTAGGDTEEASTEQRRADALALIAESALAHALDPGLRSDRYQVVLHVDAPVLADPGCPGLCHLEEGPIRGPEAPEISEIGGNQKAQLSET